MRQEWSPEDLVGCWTLVEGDWDQVGNKSGPTRLGFALLLKFFEVEGRFPAFAEEIPPVAVDYVAGLVKVPAAEFAKYDLTSRAAVFHRAQIRNLLGFRESTRADEEPLTAWLAAEICPVKLVEARRREALLARCLALQVEPPGPTRIERIVSAAAARAEATFCTRTIERLGAAGVGRLLSLVDARVRPGARRARGAQTRPGRGRLGLAARRDREAVLGPRPGPIGRSVRRRLGQAGRRVAVPCDRDVSRRISVTWARPTRPTSAPCALPPASASR